MSDRPPRPSRSEVGGRPRPTIDPVGEMTSQELRRGLVDQLRTSGYLRDDRVAAAFAAVPRELFLAAHAERHGLADVYRDDAIVTRRDAVTGAPRS